MNLRVLIAVTLFGAWLCTYSANSSARVAWVLLRPVTRESLKHAWRVCLLAYCGGSARLAGLRSQCLTLGVRCVGLVIAVHGPRPL